MKKAILAIAALGTVCCFADVSNYFYWGIAEDAPDFSYAVLTWTLSDGTTKTAEVAGHEGEPYADSFGITKGVAGGMLANLGKGDLAGSSFSAGLYDGSEQQIGEALTATYAEIVAGGGNIFYTDMDPDLVGVTPYLFTTGAVPEPMSGLLMLVGLGAMALKRRRAKKA